MQKRLADRAVFDPKSDVRLGAAAKRFGFSKHYFAYMISPAYNIHKFVDAKGLFFKKSDLDRLETTMANRVNEQGYHKSGKFPQNAKRRPAIRNGKPNNGVAVTNGQLTIGITPKALVDLIKLGTKVHLVVE